MKGLEIVNLPITVQQTVLLFHKGRKIGEKVKLGQGAQYSDFGKCALLFAKTKQLCSINGDRA